MRLQINIFGVVGVREGVVWMICALVFCACMGVVDLTGIYDQNYAVWKLAHQAIS